MKNKTELAFHKSEYGDGVSLRDYFAAAALAGCLANSFLAERYGVLTEGLSKECYEYADAMLKARDKYLENRK